MIDPETETLVSFTDAAKLLPHQPHVSTFHRWRLKGIRGIQLESLLVGGRRFTSLEAISRFIAATTAAVSGQPTPQRTPARRERDIERARQELADGRGRRGRSPRG